MLCLNAFSYLSSEKETRQIILFLSYLLLVSIFLCGPKATRLLCNVQMKPTPLLSSIKRRELEAAGLKTELATTGSVCFLMELVGLLGEAGQDMTATETLRKLSLKYSHLAGKRWARFQNLASIFMLVICRRI